MPGTRRKQELYDETLALGLSQIIAAAILEPRPVYRPSPTAANDLFHDFMEADGEADEWARDELYDREGYRVDEELFASEDDFSAMLELSGMNWVAMAESFYPSGPGSRGPYGQIPRLKDFFATCLQAPDREFRHMFRISRDTFDRLVALLARNPLFQEKERGRKQRHVKYQLAAFLVWYGLRGTDTLWASTTLSIGFGSVFNYCRRVTKALRQLRDKYVGWPTPERKHVISSFIEDFYRFPNCLGSGDGSLIQFTEKPRVQGTAYQCRKKFVATNVQAIVDHEGRITSYELAFPGSVPDSKIWKESDIWKRRHLYFQGDEYILVDKGYPSSPFVLRPFSDPEIHAATQEDRRRMKEFNYRLSKVRIVSEHAFGRLKGRFPGLKEFGVHRSMDDTYEAIEALLVLHNICIDWNDKPENIYGFDPKDDFDLDAALNGYVEEDFEDQEGLGLGERLVGEAAVPVQETDVWLKEAGRVKRLRIFNNLFPL